MLGLLARISVARLRNWARKVSSSFSRSAFSAARSSAFFARSDAISASDEARSAASSAFGTRPLLGQRLHLSFVALPQLFPRTKACSAAASRASAAASRDVASRCGFGGLVVSGKPPGVPAPEYEERGDGHARLHVAANMKRVVGVIVCFCVCFHAKIAIYSRKNTPYRGMCVNLAPQRNF